MDWQRETTAFQPQPPALPTTLRGVGDIECNAWENQGKLDQEGFNILGSGVGLKLSWKEEEKKKRCLPKYLFNSFVFLFFSLKGQVKNLLSLVIN